MKKRPYFEGWYLKQQSDSGCLALIPSFHVDEKGEKTVWLQVITDCDAYSFSFPVREYSRSRKHFQIKIGNNVFSQNGIFLNLEKEGISIHGRLHFGEFTLPVRDLMGPFRFLSMECSHGVESFYHRVDGPLVINHRTYYFNNGKGYIERDLGHSFPVSYGWTHTFLGSSGQMVVDSRDYIMACAGKIPLGKGFWGCIAVLRVNGREYKMATYRGARVIVCEKGYLMLRQGRGRLEVRVTAESTEDVQGVIGQGGGQLLKAPKGGAMNRMIEEQLSCPVHYRFYWRGKCVLDEVIEGSSVEFG